MVLVLVALVATAWAEPVVAASKPASWRPQRQQKAGPARLASSLRDDLGAGRPVRPVSQAGGRPAGPRGEDVRVVVEAVSAQAAAEAVASAGGVVVTALQTLVEADVPAGALGQLADAQKVLQVREPRRLRPTATSEGVASMGATSWQADGWSGAGVKVAVIDVGFDGYASRLGTELPANVETDLGRCSNPSTTPHGTAVAEIVHDVAPQAQLRLVCVEDEVDFVSALSTFQANGVKVVNAAIGNDLLGRGDGSGGPDTAAGAVAALRKQGILFVASAGNTGASHFHTNAVGGDGTVPVQLTSRGTFNVSVPGNGTAFVGMRWDAWPRTNLDFDLYVGNDTCGQVGASVDDHSGTPGGLEPVEATAFTNCSILPQVFEVFVDRFSGSGTPRLDLFFEGVSTMEAVTPSSVSDPAASPAALAVGATCVRGGVQPFSSRGPTIDERVKPDIVAPDSVSNSVYGPATSGCATGFVGTSAASPHVSGAAALALQSNPGLQVAEVQQLLEDWALDVAPAGKDSQTGSGSLRLQAQSTARPPTPQPFSPASPVRLFDSRPGPLGAAEAEFGAFGRTTPVNGGTEVVVLVAGVGGTPADATAVLLNVTVTNPTAPSYLTVHPGGTRPNTSNLNFAANQTAATHVTATVGADRRVRLFNATGATDVIVDVAGWYGPSGAAGPATARFTPLSAPARAFDSRLGRGYAETAGDRTTPVFGGEDLSLRVAGLGGVPPTATGVIMNVTVAGPTTSGYLTVYPTGRPRPVASNLNWAPGQVVANLVVTGTGTDGRVQVYNAGGSTHLIVDVIGWFEPNSGAGYVALDPPVRGLDTRSGNGPRLGALGNAQVHDLQVGGSYGVPTDAAAVMLGVIAVAPTMTGYLTVYPSGPQPLASSLNFSPGATVPNAVVAGLGTGGAVSFFNSNGATHVVSDLAGYFLDPANVPRPLASPPAALPKWRPPPDASAGTGSVLYLESEAGDYVGQGRTYRYTQADSVMNVSASGARVSLRLRGDQQWTGEFAGPGSKVAVGDYAGLRTYPFYNPGIDFSGEGRGCSTVAGRFIVDHVLYQGDVLNEVVLRFEQPCEGTGKALRGFLRYDADDPTQPPPPPPADTFTYRPPAGATPATGSYLYFSSSAGDYIGGGRTDLYTGTGSSFTTHEASGVVQIDITRISSSWSVGFTGPELQAALQPGAYVDVARFPFHNPAKGGFSMYGESRGCNSLKATFAVDEATYAGSQLQSVTIRFVQRCEVTGPPLYGALRWVRPS